MNLPQTLTWQDQKLSILDQTLLPHQCQMLALDNVQQVYLAIKKLQVRGAPAIGICAAYGLCVAAQDLLKQGVNDGDDFREKLQLQLIYLAGCRPTAVNLVWALQQLKHTFSSTLTAQQQYQQLVQRAEQLHRADQDSCAAIGQYGRELIQPNTAVLTHCNAGALATTGLGTALAPLYLAHDQGVRFRVYADETRPLLQGARLTQWELDRAGIEVHLLCDNMAASLMAAKKIDLIIVGADRVAANGDVANKIGTLSVAINAQYFGIPFYVAAPFSTIDYATSDGSKIEIEQRAPSEVQKIQGMLLTTPNAKIENPAFDVTPANLISGLITDKGLLHNPNTQSLAQLNQ